MNIWFEDENGKLKKLLEFNTEPVKEWQETTSELAMRINGLEKEIKDINKYLIEKRMKEFEEMYDKDKNKPKE